MKTKLEIEEMLVNANLLLERTSNKGGRQSLATEFNFSSQEYINPVRHTVCYQFLVNDFTAVPCNVEHIYSDSGWAPDDVHVKHGHFQSQLCYASYYCHLSDFQFTGLESPIFRRMFQEKWGLP